MAIYGKPHLKLLSDCVEITLVWKTSANGTTRTAREFIDNALIAQYNGRIECALFSMLDEYNDKGLDASARNAHVLLMGFDDIPF